MSLPPSINPTLELELARFHSQIKVGAEASTQATSTAHQRVRADLANRFVVIEKGDVLVIVPFEGVLSLHPKAERKTGGKADPSPTEVARLASPPQESTGGFNPVIPKKK